MLRNAFVLIAFASGCTSAQIVQERDAGADAADPGDAGVDSALPDVGPGECTPGMVDDMGTPAGCTLALPPPRPRCGPDDMDVGTIELALLDSRFRPPPGGDPFGYDLDGHCTDPTGNPSSCVGANSGDASNEGIDNTYGVQVFDSVVSAVPTIEAEFQTAIRSGRGTPLVRIEGWNGLDDDETVTATFAAAAPGMALPVWDGTDVLPVLDSFFTAGDPDLPIAQDTAAYVADGILVMQLPGNQPFDFAAGGRTLRVRFREATLTVNLNGDATTLGQSVLQGRWAASDAINDLSLLGICEGTGDPVIDLMRMAFINLFMMNQDLAANPTDDGTGADCAALSIAIAFDTGVRVTWGAPTMVEIITPC